MGQFSKKWEDLDFTDNYIFCKVMKNQRLCIQMLEILLKIKVDKIEYIESEHPIDDFYETRGIRMDVYVKDTNRIFDIELQTGDYDDLLLRSRYYLSASDLSTTPRRTKYKDLKECYIIFICKDDPFGYGIPLYSECKSFKEIKNFDYDDKSYKLFYNSSAYAFAEDEDLKEVLEFIYTLKANSKFTKELEESVFYAKQKPEFKDDYMYFADILEDEKEQARAIGLAEGREKGLVEGLEEGRAEGRAEGLEEGRAEGRAEGEAETRIENAIAFYKNGISLEVIKNTLNLTLEEIKKVESSKDC